MSYFDCHGFLCLRFDVSWFTLSRVGFMGLSLVLCGFVTGTMKILNIPPWMFVQYSNLVYSLVGIYFVYDD